MNKLQEIVMATEKWLEDALASIKTILKGDSKDHATKDEVEALSAQLTETIGKLRDNDLADADAKAEAAADAGRLQAAFDALIKQLAEVPANPDA